MRPLFNRLMVGTATALLATACASTGTTSSPGASGATGAGTTPSANTAATPPDEAAIGTSFAPPTHAPANAAPPVGAAAVYGCDRQPVVKPKTYVLLCGDGGVALDKLVWAGWGKPNATATGVQIRNSCVPNCAAGSPITTKAAVTISGLSAGRYTKLHVVTSKGATDYTIGSTGPKALG